MKKYLNKKINKTIFGYKIKFGSCSLHLAKKNWCELYSLELMDLAQTFFGLKDKQETKLIFLMFSGGKNFYLRP
jgi:hypothetical protein